MGHPRRRTRAELEALDDAIVAELAADHPQSVRHTFYRLTDPRLGSVAVPKTESGYKLIGRRMLQLRWSGRLPWAWITDATRRGYHVDTYDSGADFLRDMSRLYRHDLWSDCDECIEVWCESRSIGGVIEGECDRLAVSLYMSGGFSSATLIYQAADAIREHGKDTVVYYVGDYDPAGVLIDVSIADGLREHLRGADDPAIDFRRLAINREQIAEYDLPTKPRKAGERRRPDLLHTVEAEAMPAAALRELLVSAVESHLEPGALHVAKVAEQSERSELWNWAEVMEMDDDDLIAPYDGELK